MNLTEKEYKQLCEKMGIKYEAPNNKGKNKIIKAKQKSLEKMWKNRREEKEVATIGTKEKVIIYGRLPGFNKIILESKKHYSKYAAIKDEKTNICCINFLKQLKYNYNYIDIDILWVEPNMMRDKDNISAGVKFILDGLVEAATITNDGWKQINNISHSFLVDRKKPRIEIEITEKDNPFE